MANAEHPREPDDEGEHRPVGEHRVAPLELFFDLVMVFAFTQVTSLLGDNPTWAGVLEGLLILAALWSAWDVYVWLTSASDVDAGGGMRLAMLASMGSLLIAALAVPTAFGHDAALFGVAYLIVRLLHLALSAVVARGDPGRRGAFSRFAPPAIVAPALLLIAGFVTPDVRIALWAVALVVDYVLPHVIGLGRRGWLVAPEHFAERHGLIILIALGESIIAIGVGAGVLDFATLAGVALSVVIVSAFWWLYFDVAAILVRRSLVIAHGVERVRLARDCYSYLHLPLVAGIVMVAFGLEATLQHPGEPLGTVQAVALSGGAAAYLLGTVALLIRATRNVSVRRTVGAIVLVALVPVAVTVPALVQLGLVAAVCVLLVAWEAVRDRSLRRELRHAELSA